MASSIVCEPSPSFQQPLLSLEPRHMAPASLEAYDRVRDSLSARERVVMLGVFTYLQVTGHVDVTGGELAEFLRLPVTSVRPRLTGLCEKGWLHVKPIRASRAGERRCEPYVPAVPRAAIERISA